MKKQLSEFLTHNLNYKLVSLAMALIVWMTVLGRRDVVILKTVPLLINLPENTVIANEVINEVDYRISGTRFLMKRIEQKDLDPVKIDLSNVSIGRKLITIPDDSLRLPLGARVISINPQSVSIDLAEATRMRVPLKLNVNEELLSREKVEVVSIDPKEIEIVGAEKVVREIEFIAIDGLTEQLLRSIGENEERILNLKTRPIKLAGVLNGNRVDVAVKMKKVANGKK
jgi:YbbR domain-containing protein